jgi:hypothetical protein
MIRFLWDAFLHNKLPSFVVPLVVISSICIVPYFVHKYGLIWGSIISLIAEIGFFDKLSMPSIFPSLVTTNFYICVGVTLSLATLYFSYVHFHVSGSSQVMMLSLFVAMLYTWYLCITTPPECLKRTNR